ncbi:DUF4255 domain-containing protein [Lentzea sp. BCCO 10_0856]|uniref:DUF4255 domain-containing protein n=1 Tax=Lentzea miocenica TaxID=3095431 RepID=A0ABU4SZP1_9PSEU|nr:DUF4255 domain-containing protein [Lentzea sp. BCCO 10_0856]MDX8031382.1 DUF4255 domain-containing protein [Lentzea sp. BCCO 10_0856]
MAGFESVGAVGSSLARLLRLAFAEQQPIQGQQTGVVVIRTDDLDLKNDTEIVFPALSLLLYRVDFDKTMRAAWATRSAEENRTFLPLDLHYLVTAWADNAVHEHLIVGRTLEVLESVPTLSGPLLDPAGRWAPDESVSVVMEDLTTDDLMRTFEALTVDFRLSLPYQARVVVVAGPQTAGPPLVGTVTLEVAS